MQIEELDPRVRAFLGIGLNYVHVKKTKTKPIKWYYEGKPLSYWANLTGISPQLIRSRVIKGWPMDKAVKTPKM